MPFLREIPCDVCGAHQSRFVGIQPAVSRPVSTLLPEAADVAIVKCRSCGFFYTRPTVFWTYEELNVLYADDYFPEPLKWWVTSAERGRSETVDRLERMTSSDVPTFLDIGCGLGEVLVETCKRGWKTFGIDPSAQFVATAQANLQALGFSTSVSVATIENTGLPTDFFDILHMNSVLEHLPQPSKALKEVWRLLKPTGLAFILVPNEDRFAYVLDDIYFRVKKKREYTSRLSPFHSPYHVVGFTPSSLKLIFERNGFSVRYWDVFRGIEPWRRFGDSEFNLRGRVFRRVQETLWGIGGLLRQGAFIQTVVQKV